MGRSRADLDQPRILDAAHAPLSWAIVIATALQAYDFLAVAAVLPQIGDDLGNVELLPWVITAFPMTSAVAVLAAGPIIDNFGVQTVFRASLIAVVVASAGSALAPSVPILVAARAVTGLSSGLMMASTLSLIGLAFSRELIPKAVAFQSAAWGVMGVVGPVVAAVVSGLSNWRIVFGLNVVIGLIVMTLVWTRLADVVRVEREREPFDLKGLFLIGAATLGLLVGLQRLDRIAIPAIVVGALLGVAYWRHSGVVRHAVVKRQHVASFPTGALAGSMSLTFSAALSVDAYLPLYASAGRGLSARDAAFTVVFLTTSWSIAAAVVAKRVLTIGPTRVIAGGAATVALTLPFGAVVVLMSANVWLLYAVMTLLGVGVGCATTAGRSLVQYVSEPAELGRTNSSNQFTRMLLLSAASACVGGVLLLEVRRRVGDLDGFRELLSAEDVVVAGTLVDAIASGYGLAFVVASILGFGGLFFAVLLHRRLPAWEATR